MRRKFIGIAMALALVLGVTSLWIVSKSNEARAGQRLQLTPAFKVAYSWTYSTEGEGQSDIKSKDLSFALPNTRLKAAISGRLYLRFLAREDDSSILELHLAPDGWQYRINALEQPRPATEFSARLKIRDDGQITGFQFAESQYEAYAFIVADIFSLLEFTLPDAAVSSWSGVSQGFQGELPVSFSWQSEDAERYALTKSFQSRGATQAEGTLTMTLLKAGLWDKVSGHRQRTMKDASGNQSQDRARLDLQRIDEDWDRPRSDARVLSTHENLRGTTYQERVQRNLYESDLAGRTWKDVESLIDSLPDLPENQHVKAYTAVRAFIALHSDAISHLKDYLSLDYHDPRCSVVAAALTAVSSESAQTLLMEAFDAADGRPEQQEKLLAHLSMSERLGRAGEQKLHDVAQQHSVPRVRQTAELGIGIFGNHQKAAENKAAMQRSLEFGLNKLQTAQSSTETRHALRILGNIGAKSQIPVIEPFLHSADESLKADAIQALRRVDDPAAQRLLLGVLQSPASDTLRDLSVQSLSPEAQSQEVFDRLSQQLARERSIPVVKRIVSHLALMRDNFPEVKQLLESYRDSCGQTELRGFVSSTLIAIK